MNDINEGRRSFLRESIARNRQRFSQNRAAAPNSDTSKSANSGGTVAHKAEKRQGKTGRATKLLLAGGGTLLVALAATSGFLFWQYQKANSGNKGDDSIAASQRVIGKVQNLYMLPEGEEPTVAEIRDRDKLKDQAFFDKAENGDYLLVYQDAGLALIYRESENKLVNASPVGYPDSGVGNVSGASTKKPDILNGETKDDDADSKKNPSAEENQQ